MALCLSHGGATIYRSNSPSHELLVGTMEGVVSLERDGAKSWRVARRSLEGCAVCSLLIEPTSGLIFAGARKGSVYASCDGGTTWEPRSRGLTQKNVWSLARTQTEARVDLYVGTEPAHLFHSDDLGERWNEVAGVCAVPSASRWFFPPPPHQAHVKSIAFEPGNPKAIYLSIEQGGLLKSADGGASWEELNGFDEDVHRLLIRPSDPGAFYITGGNGLYHSGGRRAELGAADQPFHEDRLSRPVAHSPR